MTRIKRIPPLISLFENLPNDMVLEILAYDDRFYVSREGNLISRFARKDYRYILLARIPKPNYIWDYSYWYGNLIGNIIMVVFLSKNKKQRYSLSYLDQDTTRKFIFTSLHASASNPSKKKMVYV